MIFDHENGNWKNSEIASAMLEILSSNKETVEPPQAELADETRELDDGPDFVAQAEVLQAHRREAGHLIINELNKIASSLGDNQKASLELELAMEEIRDLFE
jgi:hypothetical protein